MPNSIWVVVSVIGLVTIANLVYWARPVRLTRYRLPYYRHIEWLFEPRRHSPRRLPKTCPTCHRRGTLQYGQLILKRWHRLAVNAIWKQTQAFTIGNEGPIYRCSSCLTFFAPARPDAAEPRRASSARSI